jgi:hypothetical protein
MPVNKDDFFDLSAENALKALVRQALMSAGIELDNWQRKSVDFLAGSFEIIMGGIMGGSLGLVAGELLWTVAQSTAYDADRPREEMKRKYREAARLKALELCLNMVAGTASDTLFPRFWQAFHGMAEKYGEKIKNHSANQLADLVRGTLTKIDGRAAVLFQRLYAAAIAEIG